MRRANRPLALALLFLAVLCSPAGVCVVDGVAASAEASKPTHAHACCKRADGTTIAASNGSCCAEGQNGFINVFRFALEKQAAAHVSEFGLAPASPTRFAPFRIVDRRPPLVLRI